MTTDHDSRETELRALIAQLRPAVQADGGDLLLGEVDYNTGVVKVALAGACASCAISTTTIKAGVERILKARLPWVTEVEGDLDETLDFEVSSKLGRGNWVASSPIHIRS